MEKTFKATESHRNGWLLPQLGDAEEVGWGSPRRVRRLSLLAAWLSTLEFVRANGRNSSSVTPYTKQGSALNLICALPVEVKPNAAQQEPVQTCALQGHLPVPTVLLVFPIFYQVRR